MLRKWMIAIAATFALAGAGISPSFGAACTPVTTPNTLGTTQNSVLELLESICTNGGSSSGGGLSVAYGGAIGANGTPGGLKDPATGFLQPLQGDTTNGLWVNVKSALGIARNTAYSSQTGSAIMGLVETSAAAGTNGNLDFPSLTGGRALRIDEASLAGTALGAPSNYGTSPGAVAAQGVNAFITNAPSVAPIAGVAGAPTPSGVVAANSNNSTNLKNGAGTVYGIQTSNINASAAYYLKLYDKATAPTCGTDTPVARFVIPPSNGGYSSNFPLGKKFVNGIGYCITAGIGDADNTSVPAATILANVDWN